MRLFIAVVPDGAFRAALEELQAGLRAAGAEGNFSRSENLHLTLAFLGETDRVAAARSALEEVCGGGPFSLSLSGMGRFGGVWWAGTEKNARLAALAEELRAALTRQGFRLEDRPFVAHFTLSREVRVPKAPHLAVPPVSMEVRRISLMKSERIRGRLCYTELFSAAL